MNLPGTVLFKFDVSACMTEMIIFILLVDPKKEATDVNVLRDVFLAVLRVKSASSMMNKPVHGCICLR